MVPLDKAGLGGEVESPLEQRHLDLMQDPRYQSQIVRQLLGLLGTKWDYLPGAIQQDILHRLAVVVETALEAEGDGEQVAVALYRLSRAIWSGDKVRTAMMALLAARVVWDVLLEAGMLAEPDPI